MYFSVGLFFDMHRYELFLLSLFGRENDTSVSGSSKHNSLTVVNPHSLVVARELAREKMHFCDLKIEEKSVLILVEMNELV